MTNSELISYLRANLGNPITPEICADICILADQLPTLIFPEKIDRLQSEQYEGFTFSVEKMEDIKSEVKPLHQMHWQETEGHRHGLELKPDYTTFERYERAGRYILFTLRNGADLLGNCAMYLDNSTHTQTLIATEDTLYLLPAARQGKLAAMFIAYCEQSLKQLGVKEISVSVKTMNKAGRYFRMLGYRHVENGLTKILED